MKVINTVQFPSFGDSRGQLVALESHGVVPFDIKRIYYLFDTKVCVSRGYHAHINLEQIAICVKGSCKFILDDGFERDSIILDSPTKGLHIKSMVWREMHNFSSDCVLVVLASEIYNESDYIRDYQKFMGLVHGDG